MAGSANAPDHCHLTFPPPRSWIPPILDALPSTWAAAGRASWTCAGALLAAACVDACCPGTEKLKSGFRAPNVVCSFALLQWHHHAPACAGTCLCGRCSSRRGQGWRSRWTGKRHADAPQPAHGSTRCADQQQGTAPRHCAGPSHADLLVAAVSACHIISTTPHCMQACTAVPAGHAMAASACPPAATTACCSWTSVHQKQQAAMHCERMQWSQASPAAAWEAAAVWLAAAAFPVQVSGIRSRKLPPCRLQHRCSSARQQFVWQRTPP